MLRIDFYKIKRGDNLGDPETWNKRFEDIDLRIAGAEARLLSVDEARDALVERGLTEIREQINVLMQQETALAWELINNAVAASQAAAGVAEEHAETAGGHAADAQEALDNLRDTMVDVTNTIAGIRAHVANPDFDLAPGSYLIDDISSQFNGVKKVFDLRLFTVPKTPASATQLIVHLGNSYQVPGTGYTTGGATIEFSEAPLAGWSCSIVVTQLDTSDLEEAEAAAVSARDDAIDAKDSAQGSATAAVNALSAAETVLGAVEGKAIEVANTVDIVEGHAETATGAKEAAEEARDEAVAASRNLAWGYTFDGDVDDGNPGTARLRFDNETIGLAEQMFISIEAAEGDIEGVIELWDASSSSIRGALRIASPTNKLNWVHLHIIGGVVGTGDYRKVPVSVVASSGELADGDLVLVDFLRSGDAGTGSVSSFKGRDGSVIPMAGDYLASQVANDSGVGGGLVSDALNTLSTSTAAKLARSGGTMTGKLNLAASTEAGAGVNFGQGGDPADPQAGDAWVNGDVLKVKCSDEVRELGATGNLSLVSQAEAEEGEDAGLTAWNALRVRQAASAYAKLGENVSLCDDISADFDGVEDTFALKVDGVNAKPASAASVFCVLGGVVQVPGEAFTIFTSEMGGGVFIEFAEPPVDDLSCSLRIVNA